MVLGDRFLLSCVRGFAGKYMDRGQAGRSFYFLSPRERKYKNGARPRRDTKDRLGRWKASTGKTDERGGGDVRKEERVAGDGTTKYCKSGLAYFYFRGRGEKEKKSGWLMQELTVPEYEIKLPEKGGPGGPTLDRYVMYKIYPAPVGRKKRNNDDEAGPSNAELVESDDEGETAELPPKLSEKQAGKRPVSEGQQLRNPAAAKKKRGHRSNRLQTDGMQAPFGMMEYHDGSGQPMGYQAGAPTPVPYNNGQVQAPRQQVAYNGQVPMMTSQTAYNGQMPVTQQQGAYNGQVPMMTRQPAAYNGQMPVPQQQQVAFDWQVRPPPYGQNQTMVTRPSCPAGQAANPPPVVPQMQKQPETDEMLEKRVLEQNLEEYLWMQQQMAVMMHQKQQWTMAFMMQQQQTYFGGSNADCHPDAGAKAPQFSLDEFLASVAAEHYERSRAVPPATSGSPGEAAPVNAEGSPDSTVVSAVGGGDGNNGNHDRAESAAATASPGGSGSASAEGEMAPDMVGPSDRCSIL
ncbi:hypothetical protein VPH35_105903 [Triticum aestivum]